MKKILIIALISFACKKQQVTRPEPLAFDKKIIIFTPVTQSSIITYSYSNKKTPILINRITAGNVSTIAVADTSGKVTYLAFNINDITGVMSPLVSPNNPPTILGGAYMPICVGKAFHACAINPLCSGAGGVCSREAIIGCMAGWIFGCAIGILDSQNPTYEIKKLDRSKLIINLPPLIKV